MGTIAEKTQSVATKKQPETVKDYIKVYEKELARALPKVITAERFTRMVMTAVSQTPKLQQCTPQTFIAAMLTAAQLGLEPNTPLGQAYLIPYGTVCQFQIGYKGFIELTHRSGQLKNIEAHVVYENDDFDFEYGLEAKLSHKPAKANKGEPIWVYAIYHLNNGGYGFEVMSWEECLLHGQKYSKTYNNGPWKTNPEEMAKKTMIKKVLKYAPLKSEFTAVDETVQTIEFDNGEINVVPVSDAIEGTAVEVDTETGEIVGSDS